MQYQTRSILCRGFVCLLLLGSGAVTHGRTCVQGTSQADAAQEKREAANQQEKTNSEADKSEKLQDDAVGGTTEGTAISSGGITYTDPIHFRWKVGVKIVGGNKACKNLLVTIPVPNDWPEQLVTVHQQNVPLQSREFKFRDSDSGLRQMVATLPVVRANQEIAFEMIYNVRVSEIHAPSDTSHLVVPKKLPRELKTYLDSSPGISFRNGKLRSQVKEITESHTTAWEQAKAIYDWIGENIQETSAPPIEALECFVERSGGPEDIVGLFVAMCRINKIPARTVWVDGAQYAEFYLTDSEDNGFWFPVVLTGTREFGSLSEPRIIQQKGDNIRVPEKPQPQRFVTEFVTGEGAAKPSVEFIRELLPAGY